MGGGGVVKILNIPTPHIRRNALLFLYPNHLVNLSTNFKKSTNPCNNKIIINEKALQLFKDTYLYRKLLTYS